jgi:hypothetical protein
LKRKKLLFVKKSGSLVVRNREETNMASLATAIRALSCCAMGLAALPAAADTIPTYPLPTDLHVLATSGPAPVNPGVIVGFNPQPDPPGFGDLVDFTNPLDPTITFSVSGPTTTTILFGMYGHGPGDPYTPAPGLFSSNPVQHTASYVFDETGDGSVFQVTFDISGITGGWSSFNPQPDPPGDFGFSFTGDATLGVQIDYKEPSGAFAPLSFIPEPAGSGLLLIGAAALVGLRRKAAG